MKTFDLIIFYSSIIVIISFLLGFFGVKCLVDGNSNKDSNNSLLTLGSALLGQMFFIIILFVSVFYIFKRNVEKELISFLNNKNLSVYVNKRLISIAKADSLVKDLKFMHNGEGNRPTKKYCDVTIKTSIKEYNLKLVRSQTDSILYYLYVNNYESLVSNDIGTIRTKVLSNMMKNEED